MDSSKNPMVITGLELIQELHPKQRHWFWPSSEHMAPPARLGGSKEGKSSRWDFKKNSGCPFPLRVFCSWFAEGSHVLHMHACGHCGFFLTVSCHHDFLWTQRFAPVLGLPHHLHHRHPPWYTTYCFKPQPYKIAGCVLDFFVGVFFFNKTKVVFEVGSTEASLLHVISVFGTWQMIMRMQSPAS